MRGNSAHPLDKQNALERDIQLNGPKDPDNYRMPDGRTLSEVRKHLDDQHKKEFETETEMILARTRELSPTSHVGENLVMTKAGNIIDVTTPPTPPGPPIIGE